MKKSIDSHSVYARRHPLNPPATKERAPLKKSQPTKPTPAKKPAPRAAAPPAKENGKTAPPQKKPPAAPREDKNPEERWEGPGEEVGVANAVLRVLGRILSFRPLIAGEEWENPLLERISVGESCEITAEIPGRLRRRGTLESGAAEINAGREREVRTGEGGLGPSLALHIPGANDDNREPDAGTEHVPQLRVPVSCGRKGMFWLCHGDGRTPRRRRMSLLYTSRGRESGCFPSS